MICIVNVSAAVDKHRRTISDEIGTGTACTFKGHKLILTAEHVIRKAEPADLKFLLRVEDAIDGESNGRTGFASSVSLPIKQIVSLRGKRLGGHRTATGGPRKTLNSILYFRRSWCAIGLPEVTVDCFL